MANAEAVTVRRLAEIPWEDRVNVDGWPSRAGLYCDDRENELCMRLIDYPVGSIEPRHVHAGSHATTVLRGRALVDGLTLGPLDVVLGPGNEPHGPLDYPEGCKLFSVFHGSYYHSEVEQLSSGKHYRLVQSGAIAWAPHGSAGCEAKTLIERGVGPLLLTALRLAPGGRFESARGPRLRALLVAAGEASVGGSPLGEWDFVFVPGGACPPVTSARGATLLAVQLQ
jgi:hypothetical protein